MILEDRLALLEKRVERIEKAMAQLVADAKARQTLHPQDRRTVTEKVTFDWQG